MNGDSPCNQGGEGVPALGNVRAKALRHGVGRGREGLEAGPSVLDAAGQEALGSPEGQAFPSLWITRIIC